MGRKQTFLRERIHVASRHVPRHLFCALAATVLMNGCAGHLVSGQSDDPPASLAPWAEFSVRPSLARRVTSTTVQIGDLQLIGAGRRPEHWFRKTTTFFGGATRVQWTDSGSCTAARAVLSNMYALDVPRLTQGGAVEVGADGNLYTLSTAGRYGSGRLARLSISTTGGTPLAEWAERSLTELEACWSDLPPAGVAPGAGANRR
jgi:hypothetical protein